MRLTDQLEYARRTSKALIQSDDDDANVEEEEEQEDDDEMSVQSTLTRPDWQYLR